MPAKTRETKRDEALEIVRISALSLEKRIEETTLERLLFMQTHLGQAIELQRKIEKTEPVYEKTKYVFTAPVRERTLIDQNLERIIEGFRAYAYPESWGYYIERGTDQLMFRCDFEIEARERGTEEYLEGTRNEMLTWFGSDYAIEEVTEVAA